MEILKKRTTITGIIRNSGNYKEGVTDDAGGAATGGGRKSAGTLIEIVLITFYMIYL